MFERTVVYYNNAIFQLIITITDMLLCANVQPNTILNIQRLFFNKSLPINLGLEEDTSFFRTILQMFNLPKDHPISLHLCCIFNEINDSIRFIINTYRDIPNGQTPQQREIETRGLLESIELFETIQNRLDRGFYIKLSIIDGQTVETKHTVSIHMPKSKLRGVNPGHINGVSTICINNQRLVIDSIPIRFRKEARKLFDMADQYNKDKTAVHLLLSQHHHIEDEIKIYDEELAKV